MVSCQVQERRRVVSAAFFRLFLDVSEDRSSIGSRNSGNGSAPYLLFPVSSFLCGIQDA
jgi:hypothetical protein